MPKTYSSSSAPVSTSLSVVSADCAQNDFESIKSSLDDVLTMVESLKTKSSFESTIKNTIQVLIKHMQVLSTNCSVVSSTVDTVETDIAKTDQYAKRNTVMVTGIDYKRETETFNELTETELPSSLNLVLLFLRLISRLVIEMATKLRILLVMEKLLKLRLR